MFEKEVDIILSKHCCGLLSECSEGTRIRCSDYEGKKKLLLEGIAYGYSKASEWHYVKDKLPPEPEGKNRKILPKTYICAYRLNNAYDDFEIGDFMYLGSGIWNGENKEYPIYAWLASPVDIPEPPKEQEQ